MSRYYKGYEITQTEALTKRGKWVKSWWWAHNIANPLRVIEPCATVGRVMRIVDKERRK